MAMPPKEMKKLQNGNNRNSANEYDRDVLEPLYSSNSLKPLEAHQRPVVKQKRTVPEIIAKMTMVRRRRSAGTMDLITRWRMHTGEAAIAGSRDHG
jgi:hypothetical protein